MLNNTSTLNASTQSNAYDFSEFTKLKKESKDHSPEALKQVAKQFEAGEVSGERILWKNKYSASQ